MVVMLVLQTTLFNLGSDSSSYKYHFVMLYVCVLVLSVHVICFVLSGEVKEIRNEFEDLSRSKDGIKY